MTKIPLSNSRLLVTIDSGYEDLSKHTWHLKDGYARTRINNELIYMHHLIIGKPNLSLVTDHINQDKLDNRKENLRHTTQSENVFNVKIRSDNTSKHSGIRFEVSRNKWLVRTSGKFVGRFKTIGEAVFARDQAHLKLYGRLKVVNNG